jgi:hypothetical protein
MQDLVLLVKHGIRIFLESDGKRSVLGSAGDAYRFELSKPLFTGSADIHVRNERSEQFLDSISKI